MDLSRAELLVFQANFFPNASVVSLSGFCQVSHFLKLVGALFSIVIMLHVTFILSQIDLLLWLPVAQQVLFSLLLLMNGTH